MDAMTAGGLTLTINILPAPGDDEQYGDGRGEITDLEWSYGEGWISLGSSTPGIFEVVIPEEKTGYVLPISIRAIGRNGLPGKTSGPIMLPVPSDPKEYAVTHEGIPVTNEGEAVVVTLTFFIP